MNNSNFLVALILLLAIGGLGVHNFYLGDTKRGWIEVICLLTSWLFIPAIILLVMLIQDLINILRNC